MRHSDPVVDAAEQVGPYRIIGSLGRGGMGRLCAATREGVQGFTKVVALKWILPELANTPRFREMFLNEARTAAQLDHPSIVATYELGEFRGEYFIAMEYLPGEDLRAVIRRANTLGQRIPPGVAIHMAIACARGLHFAHELVGRDGEPMGIVHRDVNPANIMLTYHGAVKILDFGVARAKNRSFQTKTGSFKGKLRYASPEQLAGAAMDRRSDVFSLAIVLWETLTGRPLFDADNELAVVDAVRSREIVPPSTLRKDIPPGLDAVLARALSRDPNARFGTAAQFAEALAPLAVEHDREQMLARWLRDLFGADRAALKLDVARGHQVEGSVERLVANRAASTPTPSDDESTAGSSTGTRLRPRTAWSTDLPSARSQPPSTLPQATTVPSPPQTESFSEAQLVFERELVAPAETRSKSGLAVVAAGALAILAAGGYLVLDREAAPPIVAHPTASVTVRSTPPGAQIFVDGEPTGLVTPTTVNGLSAEKPLLVRLVLPAHEPVERSVSPGEALEVTLQRDSGTLVLAGAPDDAELFVDGMSRGQLRKLDVAVGRHQVRLEKNGSIVFERSVSVTGSESIVNVEEEGKP